jgi:formylglycine-generating enzyme required for sulfatase activity
VAAPAAPSPGGGAAPVRSRLNPLFPVTIVEWRNELLQCNEQFGNPTGYWCYVRPGGYVIGGWKPGDPVETLTLPGFWIVKYPITVQQYRQFMQAGGYTTERYWTPNGWQWREGENCTQPLLWKHEEYPHFNSADNQPAVGITWYEATAFAAWVNTELAGSLPAGSRVRLPTEAEWEAAAAVDGAGKRRTYPWGKQEPDTQRADFGKNDTTDSPAAVGERPAGAAACGAQDMVGSVWEATSSSSARYPVQAAVVVADFATENHAVPFRGGGWAGNETFVRCAARARFSPDYVIYSILGFRLVLSP